MVMIGLVWCGFLCCECEESEWIFILSPKISPPLCVWCNHIFIGKSVSIETKQPKNNWSLNFNLSTFGPFINLEYFET